MLGFESYINFFSENVFVKLTLGTLRIFRYCFSVCICLFCVYLVAFSVAQIIQRGMKG